MRQVLTRGDREQLSTGPIWLSGVLFFTQPALVTADLRWSQQHKKSVCIWVHRWCDMINPLIANTQPLSTIVINNVIDSIVSDRFFLALSSVQLLPPRSAL